MKLITELIENLENSNNYAIIILKKNCQFFEQ